MKLFFFQHLVWQAVATTSGRTQDEELNAVPWGQYNATADFDGVIRDVGGGRMDALLIPPFASSHASMVEQTADGRLHMGWFSGTKEGQDGVAIVYSHLQNTGDKFSKAEVLSKRDGYSNQNAVLYAEDETSTLHVFHSQQAAGQGEKAATVWHLSSPVAADGKAKDFTKPTKVFKTPGSFCKNRVVKLLDGSWLVPIYGQDKHPNYPKNELLGKRGDWDDASAYKIGAHYGDDCDNMVQPTVIRRVEGKPHLVAFFRDRNAQNIYRTSSYDDGKTWEICKKNTLPNNNAGIHAWQMRSGRIALVYNPMKSGRNKLAISLSEDGGKTWAYTRILERSTSSNGGDEFSYPTLREDRFEDGKIHVSYTYLRQTIKYSMVSEKWVMKASEEAVV